MPIYEFACNACQQRFEKLVRTTDAVIACPGCQGAEVRRLPSTFSSPAATAEFCAPAPSGCGQCGSATPGQCMLN